MILNPLKIYVEEVTLSESGEFLGSTCHEATTKEIEYFTKRPCDHSIKSNKLIFEDIPSWPFFIRTCAICGKVIGLI